MYVGSFQLPTSHFPPAQEVLTFSLYSVSKVSYDSNDYTKRLRFCLDPLDGGTVCSRDLHEGKLKNSTV